MGLKEFVRKGNVRERKKFCNFLLEKYGVKRYSLKRGDFFMKTTDEGYKIYRFIKNGKTNLNICFIKDNQLHMSL